jgi:hypothetical protein
MTTDELFYKAYRIIDRCFPSKRYPAIDLFIPEIAKTDSRKAAFLRLLAMELVPDDLRPGGDYNTPRVQEALKQLSVDTLSEIPDGSGDFMRGVLLARGISRFPDRDEDKADLQEALLCFKQAKAKGCPAADAEIEYYSRR